MFNQRCDLKRARWRQFSHYKYRRKTFIMRIIYFFFKCKGDTNSSKTIKELNSLEYKSSKLTVSFK